MIPIFSYEKLRALWFTFRGPEIFSANRLNVLTLLFQQIILFIQVLKFLVKKRKWQRRVRFAAVHLNRVKKPKQGVSAKQRKKNMGLLAAAYVGHIECLEEFMESGADVNCADNSFNWRYRNHLYATAKCSFNADYAHYENTSWSPLIYAVAHDHQEITKLLVKTGADANLVRENVTALLCAVRRGNHTLVEFLVQQRADVNIAK